jgi:hypothetical protein
VRPERWLFNDLRQAAPDFLVALERSLACLAPEQGRNLCGVNRREDEA